MLSTTKHDISASIVVFLVALPLCLGIALASGAPLFAGMIAGIVGGIVVGALSGSALGVSGPAAGLVVIVLSAIQTLGSWQAFLFAVVIAGAIQLVMGFARMGFIAFFFPSSVIKGMLTGIGVLIILKQIPHALGYDLNNIGELAFLETSGETTLTSLTHAVHAISPAAALISVVSIALMVLWDTVLSKKYRIFELLSGPLVVVIVGIFLSYCLQSGIITMRLSADHLVNLPVSNSLSDFMQQFTMPDFSMILNPYVWKTAVVLAIVASLETLLCVEATDKLDPNKRITPTNRELKAQGIGNMLSGLLGGLPITQVIIRSSANISFGAKTKLSAILHGILLLVSTLTIAEYLNMLPLASLAAILIMVGYKLAKPSIFKELYACGDEQFVPFIATIVGILLTDLLVGISIGLAFGLFFTLRHSYRNAYHLKDIVTTESGHEVHHIVLAEEVSFFNKANIMRLLKDIPENSEVIIDCTNSKAIAYDVVELIQNYRKNAKLKNISFKTIGFIEPEIYPEYPEKGYENVNESYARPNYT